MDIKNRSEDFGFGFMPEYEIVKRYMDMDENSDKNESEENKLNRQRNFKNEINEFVVNFEILTNQINLDSGIFATIYFIDSLILSNELNLEDFDKKFDKLIEKDKLKDNEFIIVDHILIRTKDERVFMIPISNFRFYLKDGQYLNKIRDIWKYSDFYIPRSIWWKSFKTLNRDLFKDNI